MQIIEFDEIQTLDENELCHIAIAIDNVNNELVEARWRKAVRIGIPFAGQADIPPATSPLRRLCMLLHSVRVICQPS